LEPAEIHSMARSEGVIKKRQDLINMLPKETRGYDVPIDTRQT